MDIVGPAESPPEVCNPGYCMSGHSGVSTAVAGGVIVAVVALVLMWMYKEERENAPATNQNEVEIVFTKADGGS